MSTTDIKQIVKEKYGQAALRVTSGGSGCCGATAASDCCDPITGNLYDVSQIQQIPEEALLASLRMRQPHGSGAAQSRRSGARPRLWRRY